MRGVFFARTSTTPAQLAEATAAGNRIVSPWTQDAMREAAWDGYCALTYYLLPVVRSGFETIDGDLAKSQEMLRVAVAQAAIHGRNRGGAELLASYMALPAEPSTAELETLALHLGRLAGPAVIR